MNISTAQTAIERQVLFQWEGIKTINDNSETTYTISLQNGLHLSELNFLPARKVDFDHNIEDLVSIKINKKDTVSHVEQSIIDRHLPSNYDLYMVRNIGSQATLLIFPFIRDSTSGRWQKITECSIRYEKQVEKKAIRRTHFRTSTSENSILAEGDWYKLAVTDDGVYKIDRDYLLKHGIDANSIDPRKIKVFGNGGSMLPQPNNEERPEYLAENAIFVSGEDDGVFNQEDYILFYGQSPHKLTINSSSQFSYQNNYYSDTTYYFIRFDGENGARLNMAANLGNTFPKVDTYNDIFYHDNNEITILSSGREWYGERIANGYSNNFNFQLPGLVKDSEVNILANAMAQSYSVSKLNIRANNQSIGELSFSGISDWAYATRGDIAESTFAYNIPSDNLKGLNITFDYQASGNGSNLAYINYFLVNCQRSLQYRNEQLTFRSTSSLENEFSTFQLSSIKDGATIWDITNPIEPREQDYEQMDGAAVFGTETFELKTFVAFEPKRAPSPHTLKPISNQNLKQEAVPDLIIITHYDFLNQAQRLADFRESRNGLSVLVTTVEEVFNEFSSGTPDPTAIRDFVKYMYEKGDQSTLKNLLLFGRCSYDFKGRVKNNTMFVPSYLSRNSLNPLATYTSDDYFAFLDDDEGKWQESFDGDHDMDIGVGRLPAKSTAEAKIFVDKLIRYETDTASYDNWRNEMIFVADDGDGNLHQEDAEKLSALVDTTFANINVNKVYVDAYEQTQGQFSNIEARGANKALRDGIDRGALIINFTGHGSETRWCSETIFETPVIRKLKNENRLPVFVTATCEFGRHDNPAVISGAEQLLLNPDGGAIGMVSTSRPVYASSNYRLSKAFYENVFRKTENGSAQDLGSIFKATKNASLSGNNNRNFSLLGDPSMTLAIPEHRIEISEITDKDNPQDAPDTLKALKHIKVKGYIKDNSGSVLSDFSGRLTAKVYDKKREVATLGSGDNSVMPFEIMDKIIFQGDVSVINGAFESEFVVPANINNGPDSGGKISLYASQETRDAHGYTTEFVIGGNEANSSDNTPPAITLFVNDTSFVEGGITSQDVRFIASVADDNGINLLNDGDEGGLIVTIDDSASFDASHFFKYELDSYQQGWLNYPFHDLLPGKHTLTLTAWDTHENRSEASIEFTVGEYFTMHIKEVKNYPNPFRDETTFSFVHSRSGEDLEVSITVLSTQGKQVMALTSTIENSNYRVDDLVWDKNANNNNYLTPGVYIYKLSVRSLSDGAFDQEIKKLIVIN